MLTVKRREQREEKDSQSPLFPIPFADRKEERKRERGKGKGERRRMDRSAESPRRMELK